MEPINTIQSVLIVKLDHIGDMILTTPVFEAVKKRYPDCFLGVLCSSMGSLALRNNPYIDKIWIYDAEMFDKHGTNNRQSKLRDLESVLDIRRRRFDVCIGLREDHENVPILSMLGAKKTISYTRDTVYPYLLDETTEHIGGKHEALANFDLLSLIDVPMPEKVVPHLYPSSDDLRWADALLKGYGVGEQDLLLGLSPGGGWYLNWWPWERFAELCNRLLRHDPRIRIVVFGGQAEKELFRRIQSAIPSQLVNAVGKGSVQQTSALMRRTRCVIANDGGPMHMATASETTVVAMFGPSPVWFFPVGEQHRVIRRAFPCSPCPQFVAGQKPSCKNNRCMKAISVDEVFQTVVEVIEPYRAGS